MSRWIAAVLLAVAACGRAEPVRASFTTAARIDPRAGDWSNVTPGAGWVLAVHRVTKPAFGLGEATQISVLVELPAAPSIGARVDLSTQGVIARCERGNLAAESFSARGSFVLTSGSSAGYASEVDFTCFDSSGAEIGRVQGKPSVLELPARR